MAGDPAGRRRGRGQRGGRGRRGGKVGWGKGMDGTEGRYGREERDGREGSEGSERREGREGTEQTAPKYIVPASRVGLAHRGQTGGGLQYTGWYDHTHPCVLTYTGCV